MQSIDVDWCKAENVRLRQSSQPVPSESDCTRLIEEVVERKLQLYKRSEGYRPDDDPETLWNKLGAWADHQRLDEECRRQLNRLCREHGTYQIAAILDSMVFMSGFKLDVTSVDRSSMTVEIRAV